MKDGAKYPVGKRLGPEPAIPPSGNLVDAMTRDLEAWRLAQSAISKARGY